MNPERSSTHFIDGRFQGVEQVDQLDHHQRTDFQLEVVDVDNEGLLEHVVFARRYLGREIGEHFSGQDQAGRYHDHVVGGHFFWQALENSHLKHELVDAAEHFDFLVVQANSESNDDL